MSVVVHVVVAAIFNTQDQVLLARRPEHVHQGGLWEFPGGKVEPGEAVVAALVRELDEELGLLPLQLRPLIRVRHDYPDKSVLLDVWRVDSFRGLADSPRIGVDLAVGREGQPLRWVRPDALLDDELPAANQAIVKALNLPSCYLITPEPGVDHGRFLQQLRLSLEQGVKLLRLRAWGLDAPAYRQLAGQVLALCRTHQARLLLSGELAWSLDLLADIAADGLHLSSAQLRGLSQARRPVADGVCLAASCHDANEIQQAAALGVDFITLSPLLPTSSHPQAQTLGWSQFQGLAEQASMPVYALGGVAPVDIEQAWQRGAQGIAAINSLWNAPAGVSYRP